MKNLETHPHLHLFDPSRKWKYLIIGTFPPNSAIRDRAYIDYFYGNKGFLWKIIHDLYNIHGYDFFRGSMKENVAEIKRWQDDYCVGLSDTIVKCSRKHPMSSDDSDLIDIVYNYDLKDYVLNHLPRIEKIIFTSSFGKNSAYENFRKIMGKELNAVADKLVTGLPSPSGSSNITFFNTNREDTLGLTEDFFYYVKTRAPHHLNAFRQRWKIKKSRRAASAEEKIKILVPPSPKGLVKEYKLWKYQQALPDRKCQ